MELLVLIGFINQTRERQTPTEFELYGAPTSELEDFSEISFYAKEL